MTTSRRNINAFKSEGQKQWEAALRATHEYSETAALIRHMDVMRSELAKLARSPVLETDAGMLARIDKLQSDIAASLGSQVHEIT